MAIVHEIKFFRKDGKLFAALFDQPPPGLPEYWIDNLPAGDIGFQQLPDGTQLNRKYQVERFGKTPWPHGDEALVDDLLQEIEDKWSAKISRPGRLIQTGRFLHWHYAVALSDEEIISWGSDSKKRGLRIEGIRNKNYSDAIMVPYLPDRQIFENVLLSCFAFHNYYYYNLGGWNCEHWARLVTSGQSKSYQTIIGGLIEHHDSKAHLVVARKLNHNRVAEIVERKYGTQKGR